jgi:hypothetical protein
MFTTISNFVWDLGYYIFDWFSGFEYKQKLLAVIFLIGFAWYATIDTDGVHDLTPLVCLGPICIFAFFTKDTII